MQIIHKIRKIADAVSNKIIDAHGRIKSAHIVRDACVGETLIECIIAISVLMIILAPASALYVASGRTIAMNRADLVAAALAEEGLEIMRNFRDTNLIKFSQKADQCWNAKPDPSLTLATCADNVMGATDDGSRLYYELYLDPETMLWSMDDNGLAEAWNPQFSNYRLRQDIATESDPECLGMGCHTHMDLFFAARRGVNDARGALSPYYRQIRTQYYDIDSPSIGKKNAIKVESVVQYQVGGQMRTIQRDLILTSKPPL